jgi:hypothetical protein
MLKYKIVEVNYASETLLVRLAFWEIKTSLDAYESFLTPKDTESVNARKYKLNIYWKC